MIITSVAIIFILILAIADFKSIKSNNHKDFQKTILSAGILAGLINIYILILQIENENEYLDVIAYIKSIFYAPMFAIITIIIINIYQKRKIIKTSNNIENINYIANQSTKCNYLEELPKITEVNLKIEQNIYELTGLIRTFIESSNITINNVMNNNNANFTNLSNNINKSIKNNLEIINNYIKNNIEINKITNKNLDSIIESNNDIKITISKEMEKLSNNFSQDVIYAIGNLSNEWNNNINKHFSENFKRFNNGIDQLIEWQDKYKQTLLDSNDILSNSKLAINKINESLDQIINRDSNMINLYNEVSNIMNDYKKQNNNLEEKLKKVKDLGISANEALKTMGIFFNELNSHLKITNDNMINNTKKTIDNIFISSIRQFEDINKKIVDDMNNRDKCVTETIQKISSNIESINNSILNESKTIIKNYQNINNKLENLTKNTSSKIEELSNSSIKQIHNNVDNILNDLMKKYLNSLEQLNIQTLESSKELLNTNLEDIKIINNQITDYLKGNSHSLNKTNIEILNIINIMQEYIQKTIDINKDINTDTKKTINNIKDSLQSISNSFKGDYEWFLRRIREIIGQRL